MSRTLLLSTAYLPSIAWFQHALNAKQIFIEAQENYLKQTYRNRCKILSANGIQELIIPIQHQDKKQLITEIKTNPNFNWKKQHWQSICSAYGKSAFFLYYRDRFEPIYSENLDESLFHFNLHLIELVATCLKLELTINPSTRFEPISTDYLDKRLYFNAKGNPKPEEMLFVKPYFQVFSEKFPFEPNLSIIDLLFNLGPQAKDYLLLKG